MKIEILQIFKESFKDVCAHKLEWMRVAYAPFTVWFISFLFMTLVYWSEGQSMWSQWASMNQPQQATQSTEPSFMMILANIIYYFAYLIAVVSVYINGFRYALLQEGGERWWTLNLNWRFVKMILYYILIALLAGIYIAVSIGIVVGAQAFIGSVALTVILGILLGLFGIYLMLRLALTFVLISIDRNNPLKTSWNLLKGNVLRLFGLVLLIGGAILLIGLAGALVLGILGWLLALISPWLAGIALLLFLGFGILMWLLNWAVISKSMALVYKTFTEGKAF